MVKFGGPIFLDDAKAAGAGESHGAKGADPELLVAKHKEKGYTAAYAPNIDRKDIDLIKATRKAFERENIILAEVGYWQNIMSTDDAERKRHRDNMLDAFYFADEIGARCAVNIWGSYCHGNGSSQHCAEFKEVAKGGVGGTGLHRTSQGQNNDHHN